MHNTAFAEWLLARFTSKPQAAVIMGDFEEASAQKGIAWFWRSYLFVLLASAWRPAAAYLVIVFADDFLGRTGNSIFWHSAKMHHASQAQQAWLAGGLNIFLSTTFVLAIYALLRFGPRDAFTKLALAFSLLGFGTMAFWWQPALSIGLGLAFLALLVVTLSSSVGRRRLASLSVMAILMPIMFLVTFFSVALGLIHLHWPFNQGIVDYVLKPLFTLATCIVFGRTHRSLQERKDPIAA